MLENFIKKYDLLDHDFCDEIVLNHKNAPWQEHIWKGGEDYEEAETKKLDPSILYMDQAYGDTVFRRLSEKITDYFEETTESGHALIRGFTPPRFNLYLPDQRMEKHIDHIHSIFDGNIRGIPILSIITLVNDEYEGGEFCFNLCGKEVEYEIKKGQCLIWPSVFLYPHYVKPVTSGKRQSFVVWAY